MSTAAAVLASSRQASASPQPRRPVYRGLRALVQHGVVFPGIAALCRPVVTGREQLDELTGPYVVVANHVSHLDCPVLLACLPRAALRRTSVAAATDYFYRSRVRGALVSLAFSAIPLDRHGNPAAALRTCGDVLRRGGVLVMFPEGTRSRDGSLGSFRCGAARVAIEHGVPVVPIATRGLHDVLAPGAILPHAHRVYVRVGAPLRRVPGESVHVFTARIHAAVAELAA
jgi:1-acyl-sn-glycerol-3-phosphate acyltransferase